MMQSQYPFRQVEGTVTQVVTATSAAVTPTRAGMGTQTVRITNVGTQVIFVTFADTAAVATVATGMPILPNSVEVFYLKRETTSIAAIAAGAGSTMYVTTGESA